LSREDDGPRGPTGPITTMGYWFNRRFWSNWSKGIRGDTGSVGPPQLVLLSYLVQGPADTVQQVIQVQFLVLVVGHSAQKVQKATTGSIGDPSTKFLVLLVILTRRSKR
jgi:hypothetical protein